MMTAGHGEVRTAGCCVGKALTVDLKVDEKGEAAQTYGEGEGLLLTYPSV